jgi:methionyl-tRNA formyltransferase
MRLDRIVLAGGGPIFDAVRAAGVVDTGWVIAKDRPIRPHDIEGADLLLCIGHPQVLTPAILNTTYCVNLHTSLLPRHRGRHPVNWAMIQGDLEIGLTLHEMVPVVDAGPIIVQWPMRMDPTRETYTDVMVRLAAIAPACVEIGLQEIRDDRPAAPQDESVATYEPPRTPKDSQIDWTLDYERIACFINGQHPDTPAFDVNLNYRHVEVRR